MTVTRFHVCVILSSGVDKMQTPDWRTWLGGRGLRGWLHGEISARAGISARLLTY